MRHHALWGTGRESRLGSALVAALVFALALPAAGAAGVDRGKTPSDRAFVPERLLDAARSEPSGTFAVIVQGSHGRTSDAVASVLSRERGRAVGLKRRFESISGVATDLTGKEIVRLANRGEIRSISQDAPMILAGQQTWDGWTTAAGVPSRNAYASPTIAIVDSGVDASHPAFGGRVVEQVTLTSLAANSPGDGRGHGTMVASIAAAQGRSYPGVSPSANLVSIDVMDDNGAGRVSDVIAACDWILANKDRLNVRVANFSLHAATPSSFRFDPLDQAVEKLWLNGVVVVAAAGNYGADGQPTRIQYAPANDPFVITVGASDIKGNTQKGDDGVAPWSAYGYTLDGFAKPELVAPGRYMAAAVPARSTLALARPDRVVGSGYMWMSGTSFAAPVVAGAAAVVLARNPGYTPDQVKGALMATAERVYQAPAALARGMGEVFVANAWKTGWTPPNPNRALDRFVVSDSATGLRAFDAAAWSDAAWSDAAWSDAAWADSLWVE